jgi:1-acyl-sn-glycerol-3-phosphate acyltransferase
MQRPDLIAAADGRLGFIERQLIRFVRASLEPGRLDALMRLCQRHLGSKWIVLCTRRLLHVYGRERLPTLDPAQAYICVANHRSFFDLYVITSWLIGQGMRHRIVFPVRSKFFYTNPLGLLVNGAMSFFAMYPPIFRERAQLRINPTSLADLAWIINRGGAFVGFHPEGTRNKGDDPYTLLPAQRGLGPVVQATRAKVIPVFINGLRTHGLVRQVWSTFDGTGKPIVVVFGEPIDFDDLREEKSSIKAHTAIAERALDAIRALGDEEREHRTRLERAATGE